MAWSGSAETGADYDGWAEAGNAGWDFHSVFPLFQKSEDWEDGDVYRSPARCGDSCSLNGGFRLDVAKTRLGSLC
jgi:hypothetical protein